MGTDGKGYIGRPRIRSFHGLRRGSIGAQNPATKPVTFLPLQDQTSVLSAIEQLDRQEKTVLSLNKSALTDLGATQTREWMITNGMGGYASSTVSGMNTRRYHGLLVAATRPPVGRLVMLSKLEETVILNGERLDLSTNLYGGGTIHPEGYRFLENFALDPFPVFTFSGDGFTLTKSIFMVQGSNTVVIEYTLVSLGQSDDLQLEVRPLIAFRDYHSTTHENPVLDPTVTHTAGCVRLQPYQDQPAIFLAHDADSVLEDGHWYRNFEFAQERARGLDFQEDLFSPLVFQTSLNAARRRFVIIASTQMSVAADAADLRTEALALTQGTAHTESSETESSAIVATLVRAARQFIVARPPFKTVIAGYHWFGDWGRDTMIALPGLLLSTDQPETAREILLEFLKYVDGGMLPNRFPDQGETPEYNTVDATLWFFEAIWQYQNYFENPAQKVAALRLIETTFYPALKNIVEFHLSGTRFGIHADGQGFLWAGDGSTQLTWMDAKVGDIAITPRAGRPVEIQALWYNALKTLEEFARKFGDDVAADRYSSIAATLKERFADVFWNADSGCLFDVVGDSSADASIRPNQVIAISLRHDLLDADQASAILSIAERELLTPFGLRTLAPSDPNYRGRYEGDVWSRDSAYHQGTVWPWLIGPYFAAKLKWSSQKTPVIEEASAWLESFRSHFLEAGLGQASEIFDGDAPYQARGCIAQAWSVSEVLRLARSVERHTRIAMPAA